MKKLIVNQDTCIGCGACIQIDEEHFDFSPKGTSVVINQDNLESEAVAIAIDACPVGAISINEVKESEDSCQSTENNESSKCHCNKNSEDEQCHCHDEHDNHCDSCENNCSN